MKLMERGVGRVSSLLLPFSLLPFWLGASSAGAQAELSFRDVHAPAQARVDALLRQMTLEEKISCLGTDTAVPRLGIKSFGSSEGIHGVVQRRMDEGGYHNPGIATTQFPQPPGMGETWDPALVQQAGATEGAEARYISDTPAYKRRILMLWGPQADLARDPRWGRSEEVYGEDPFFNGTMVTAFVHGLQGPDPEHWQTAALLKHFLANSNENGRTKSNSVFDERLFWEYYSVPFRMGFQDGGARGVMASYNAWNGTPMVVNPVLKSVVEDRWGVDVLSSDGGAVKLLWTDHKAFPNQKAAVIACLHAGINQFLDEWKEETRAAIKEGSVTEAEIDGLLQRKFIVSLKLGLLDPAEDDTVAHPSALSHAAPPPWDGSEHRHISEQMALESVVLLKNEHSTLPLDKVSMKSIAVIGPLANVVHWDWYGGDPPYAVTPLDGIKAAVGPYVQVNFADGSVEDAALEAARRSEIAVVVVGNNPTCGPDMMHDWHDTVDGGGTLPCTTPSDGREGRDRETLTLEQEQLVKQVYAINPKTVVVLVSSFPYTIQWSQDHVPAILHMAHSSQDEGTALARVLFGDYNPGGHLVTTWPASMEQLPAMNDYDIRDGRTYMYAKGKPLYPFGYGLSYTTFQFDHLRVDHDELHSHGSVEATVDVTNTGKRAGDAVVQMYVAHQGSAVLRPRQELKGFRRVSVAAGKTVPVTITLHADDLRYWNTAIHNWTLEPDHIELRIAANADEIEARHVLTVKP